MIADDVKRWQRWTVIGLAIAVAAIHASPQMVWYARHHGLLTLLSFDEVLYSARIVEAYRGGSVASPFLAGHSNAQDYMPQMVERSIAGAAAFRPHHLPPLGMSRFRRLVDQLGAVTNFAQDVLPPVIERRRGLEARIALAFPLNDERDLPCAWPRRTGNFAAHRVASNDHQAHGHGDQAGRGNGSPQGPGSFRGA